jgi:hypothetical protein
LVPELLIWEALLQYSVLWNLKSILYYFIVHETYCAAVDTVYMAVDIVLLKKLRNAD